MAGGRGNGRRRRIRETKRGTDGGRPFPFPCGQARIRQRLELVLDVLDGFLAEALVLVVALGGGKSLLVERARLGVGGGGLGVAAGLLVDVADALGVEALDHVGRVHDAVRRVGLRVGGLGDEGHEGAEALDGLVDVALLERDVGADLRLGEVVPLLVAVGDAGLEDLEGALEVVRHEGGVEQQRIDGVAVGVVLQERTDGVEFGHDAADGGGVLQDVVEMAADGGEDGVGGQAEVAQRGGAVWKDGLVAGDAVGDPLAGGGGAHVGIVLADLGAQDDLGELFSDVGVALLAGGGEDARKGGAEVALLERLKGGRKPGLDAGPVALRGLREQTVERRRVDELGLLAVGGRGEGGELLGEQVVLLAVEGGAAEFLRDAAGHGGIEGVEHRELLEEAVLVAEVEEPVEEPAGGRLLHLGGQGLLKQLARPRDGGLGVALVLVVRVDDLEAGAGDLGLGANGLQEDLAGLVDLLGVDEELLDDAGEVALLLRVLDVVEGAEDHRGGAFLVAAREEVVDLVEEFVERIRLDFDEVGLGVGRGFLGLGRRGDGQRKHGQGEKKGVKGGAWEFHKGSGWRLEVGGWRLEVGGWKAEGRKDWNMCLISSNQSSLFGMSIVWMNFANLCCSVHTEVRRC